MTTVGIIAEYNPFHQGHAYHIKKIREEFGEDTRIVAVMSGNYTQRGGIAVADKFTRAAAALRCGVNLVLELPFPHSGESAPLFARAGMAILSHFPVDVLSFGSECGDIATLTRAAVLTDSEELRQQLFQSTKGSLGGFPGEAVKYIASLYGDEIADLFRTPNNLLGIEYIREGRRQCPALSYHTVKRIGARHRDTAVCPYASASLIRQAMREGDATLALSLMPPSAQEIYRAAFENGLCPASLENLNSFILSYFCLNTPDGEPQIADAGGGLYRRIFAKAQKASDIHTLIRLTATKRYTDARIRRAIRNTVLGVTSSETEGAPHYTQLLGFDDVGREIISGIAPGEDFALLTKPADTHKLPPAARREAEKALRADSLYTLSLPDVLPRDYFLKCSPVRMTAKDGENFSLSTFVEGIDKKKAK